MKIDDFFPAVSDLNTNVSTFFVIIVSAIACDLRSQFCMFVCILGLY